MESYNFAAYSETASNRTCNGLFHMKKVCFWGQHRMPDATNFKVSTMKKKAVGLFETLLIIYKTKGCHKPEDHCLHYYRR